MVLKILVADPNPTTRKVVELTLEGENAELFCTSEGEEALKMAEVYLPDVILYSESLGDMDVLQFRQKLQEHPKLQKLPFIVLISGRGVTAQELRGWGISLYLEKPFEARELVDMIDQATSGRPSAEKGTIQEEEQVAAPEAEIEAEEELELAEQTEEAAEEAELQADTEQTADEDADEDFEITLELEETVEEAELEEDTELPVEEEVSEDVEITMEEETEEDVEITLGGEEEEASEEVAIEAVNEQAAEEDTEEDVEIKLGGEEEETVEEIEIGGAEEQTAEEETEEDVEIKLGGEEEETAEEDELQEEVEQPADAEVTAEADDIKLALDTEETDEEFELETEPPAAVQEEEDVEDRAFPVYEEADITAGYEQASEEVSPQPEEMEEVASDSYGQDSEPPLQTPEKPLEKEGAISQTGVEGFGNVLGQHLVDTAERVLYESLERAVQESVEKALENIKPELMEAARQQLERFLPGMAEVIIRQEIEKLKESVQKEDSSPNMPV